MFKRRKVVKVLTALSELERDCETSRCIADKLIAGGFVGSHGARICPVALYLKTLTGLEVSVGGLWCWLDGENIISVPSPIHRFIVEFDCGIYPELDIIR
jgi:hypothetical protein